VERVLTVGCLWRGKDEDDIVPSIRLEGKWLGEIVAIGQRVSITVTSDSTIVITPILTDKNRTYATGNSELRQATLALRF
jgi:hypothetical protein